MLARDSTRDVCTVTLYFISISAPTFVRQEMRSVMEAVEGRMVARRSLWYRVKSPYGSPSPEGKDRWTAVWVAPDRVSALVDDSGDRSLRGLSPSPSMDLGLEPAEEDGFHPPSTPYSQVLEPGAGQTVAAEPVVVDPAETAAAEPAVVDPAETAAAEPAVAAVTAAGGGIEPEDGPENGNVPPNGDPEGSDITQSLFGTSLEQRHNLDQKEEMFGS